MARRLIRLIEASAVVVVVFGSVPVVLALAAGTPLPRTWSVHALAAPRTLLDVVAIVAWVAWARYCVDLLRGVADRVRRRDVAVRAGASLQDRLAARVAGAVLVIVPVSVVASSAALAAVRAPAVIATATTAQDASPTVPRNHDLATTAAAVVEQTTYTVVAGDCLSMIAQRLYGSAAEWPVIAQENLGRVMDDGRRFVDPNLIMPGWVLFLPDPLPAQTAAPSTPVPSSSSGLAAPTPTPLVQPPAPRPRSQQSVHVARSKQAAKSGTRRSAPARPDRERDPAIPHAPGRSEARHTATASQSHSSPPLGSTSHRYGNASSRDDVWRPVPEAAVLGVGALVAAALVRRVRHHRRLARALRVPGQMMPEPTEDTAAIETLIEPFAELPALDLLELASRHLTAAVAAEGRAEIVPRIRLVRVGPNGVELLLAEQRSWAPGSFCSTDDGHTWMLPASVDCDALATDARRHPVWMPALVPIGDDADGTYLVSLEPGGALPITGPDAPRALSAMQVAAMSWPWSEQLTVTDDPAHAANEALAVTDASVTDERLRVVFVGDATALDEETRQRVSILGAATKPDDLAVVAAGGRGTIEPLGVSLDLCRFEQSEQAEAVDELMESAARAAQDAGVPRAEGSAELMSPGPVEVRLLTAVPRIDGLVEPLDGLARRATELVAYLALQEGRPVEGDRLRARVLGPADADAAPRTMMNLASAARRSLGLDAGGMPRLSKASNSGLYRLSPEVTTDVDRLVHMARAGVAADDAVAAVELCTTALELVEDEPLCAAGGRYTWWQAEQAGRLANAAVDAACRLAELADAGAATVSAARRGVERARLLAPWDEALDRAAMTVEHAAGNRPGIEHAYAECKRKAEELAPGALPSERTEALYADLTRRSAPLAADDREETVATAALG